MKIISNITSIICITDNLCFNPLLLLSLARRSQVAYISALFNLMSKRSPKLQKKYYSYEFHLFQFQVFFTIHGLGPFQTSSILDGLRSSDWWYVKYHMSRHFVWRPHQLNVLHSRYHKNDVEVLICNKSWSQPRWTIISTCLFLSSAARGSAGTYPSFMRSGPSWKTVMWVENHSCFDTNYCSFLVYRRIVILLSSQTHGSETSIFCLWQFNQHTKSSKLVLMCYVFIFFYTKWEKQEVFIYDVLKGVLFTSDEATKFASSTPLSLLAALVYLPAATSPVLHALTNCCRCLRFLPQRLLNRLCNIPFSSWSHPSFFAFGCSFTSFWRRLCHFVPLMLV